MVNIEIRREVKEVLGRITANKNAMKNIPANDTSGTKLSIIENRIQLEKERYEILEAT